MAEWLPEWLWLWFDEDTRKTLSYLTNGKHMAWYASLRYTIIAALGGGFLALLFGLVGAALRQSSWALFRGIGWAYITMVRGIPDVLIIIFLPLAIEQGVEWVLAQSACTAQELAADGLWPPCPDAQWFLSSTEYLVMACLSLGVVFGAFAANVIHGGLQAVGKGQLEAGRAYGLSEAQVFWGIQVRQMWIYALPGLSNVWVLLLKATSLLSLLQIADIVVWADRLGAPNYIKSIGLVHPDWRWKYYLVLFLLFILLTWLSERFFAWITKRASKGMVKETV